MNPRGARVVALEKPTERELTQWYFQRYIQHLPAAGEIVMFDRSWYNRAGVERVMGYCSHQYLEFTRSAPGSSKCWSTRASTSSSSGSPSAAPSNARFVSRSTDKVKRWKLSPTDLASLDKWDAYTEAKEAMFFYTDTPQAPWTVVKSNDKEARAHRAMRWVLSQFDYPNKDVHVVGKPDSKVIGSPKDVYDGEGPSTSFPSSTLLSPSLGCSSLSCADTGERARHGRHLSLADPRRWLASHCRVGDDGDSLGCQRARPIGVATPELGQCAQVGLHRGVEVVAGVEVAHLDVIGFTTSHQRPALPVTSLKSKATVVRLRGHASTSSLRRMSQNSRWGRGRCRRARRSTSCPIGSASRRPPTARRPLSVSA